MNPVRSSTSANRGYLYDLLSIVFRRPLDGEKLERMRQPEMQAALVAAGIELDEDFIHGETGALLERLAIDYTRLFNGPEERISPYESIQTGESKALVGDSTHGLRRFMADNGFEMAADSGELPDHISVELALMGSLAESEGIMIEQDDHELAAHAAALQRQLLEKHLGRWVEGFAKKVSNRAKTRFYASMAGLLAAFINAECRELEASP